MANTQTTSSTAPASPAPAGSAPAPGGGGLFGLMPLVLIMVLFYVMLVVPQNKEKKKREKMLSELKPGDRVLTTGGLWGTVASVSAENDVVLLKVADQVKVEVAKAYILSVDAPPTAEKK